MPCVEREHRKFQPPSISYRFLSGQNFVPGLGFSRFRHVVVLCLQNDRGDMLKAYSEFSQTSTSDSAWVIATWLAHKVVEPSEVIADQDLKAPGAQTIQAAVLERLKVK